MINKRPRNLRYFFNPDHHPDPTPEDEVRRIKRRMTELDKEKKRLYERLRWLKETRRERAKQSKQR